MMWNEYPYSNVHELNLDWIVKEIIKVVREQVLIHGEIDDVRDEMNDLENRVEDLVQYYITKAIQEGTIEVNLLYNSSDESLEFVIGG